MTQGFCLFETAIGTCGVAWGERGLTGVQLPQSEGGDPRVRLARRYPQAVETDPPPAVADAIAGMQALLAGEPRDLLEIVLDTRRLTPFQRLVYETVRRIPPGQTRSYGEIAQAVGRPQAARAIGQAMGFNPFAPVVPCHRVLAAGRRPGGFSATGGAATKLRMLAIEGALRGETCALF